MHWGHKIMAKDGQQDATRTEFNAAFGVDSPEPPEIPDAVAHVWEWWWKLNARRTPGFDSLSPITYSDIYHWSALTRTQVTPSEVNILIQMDDAFMQAVNTEKHERQERERANNDKGAK